MRALRQLATVLRTLTRARRNRTDLLRALVRRPQLLVGTGAFELGLVLSARVDPHLKALVNVRAASLIGCEFCLDIGSALATGHDVSERQLRELHRYRESDAFTEVERLVIELADAQSRTPAVVSDDLRARLDAAFSPAQVTELAAAIAWENHRSRLNQALGVRPSGFSDGAYCLLPDTTGAAVG